MQCCGSNVTGGTRGAHCRMAGAIALEAIALEALAEAEAEDKAGAIALEAIAEDKAGPEPLVALA